MSIIAASKEFLLFGGTGHDKYLGCIGCGEFSRESICNEFGKGSSFNSDSIFNEFGHFGSAFSSESPWNEFTSSDGVPVVVDRNGGFYGYFTINAFRRDAVDFSSNLGGFYKSANGKLDLVQKLICSNGWG